MKNNVNNRNEAPYPEELLDLVTSLSYRPYWRITLTDEFDRGQGCSGLTLIVRTSGYNSYHIGQGQTYNVLHFFPVPAAAYNRSSWQRWLLDQLIKVETHEACEFFNIVGDRPYAPHHGDGEDPYTIFDKGTEEETQTRPGQ